MSYGNEISGSEVLRATDKSREELCDWLDGLPFDPVRAASMPSFKAFEDRLDEVVSTVLHG